MIDSQFTKILSLVDTTIIQNNLAEKIKALLKIGNSDLTDYPLIEQKIGRTLTDDEKYKLRNLSRSSNFGSGTIMKSEI